MCLAQCILLFLPALYKLCDRIGYLSFLIIFIGLQYMSDGIVSESGGEYSNYLMVVVLGILCAQKQFFERRSKKSKNKLLNLIEAIILFLGFFIFMYLRVRFANIDGLKITTVCCSISVLCISLLCFKFLKSKYLVKFFTFGGRHSGNIFMMHAFIYIYFPQYVYWSHNVTLSWLILMLTSCILSIIIERFKRMLHYNNGIAIIETIVLNHMHKK